VYDERVTPSAGGFAHVDVPLPEPGARYRYVFFEMEGDTRLARSPIGRFRAAVPDSDRSVLRLGAVSCTRNGHAFRTLGHAAARDDLDAFLYLGDTTYADGSTTLDDYRAKWAENLATGEYRGLRASVSALATLDDHEVDNNFDPETVDAAQLAAGLAAFHEHQPIRLDADLPGRRIWKSVRWGQTVEVFVLDCRTERRPSTRTTSEAIYVSREQMQWLTMGLLESTAVFKVIMSSVPISDFPGAFDLARDDRWEGYAAQRTEILRFIDDNAISGVLWVAGDFHMASAGRVSTSGVGSDQVEVLVGPGAHDGNILAATLFPPQFDWATSRDNYAVIELDPSTSRASVFYHDEDDSVLEVLYYTL
jgi:phosphodiesterase/alkaline phosphatase D-like protein